MIPPSKKKLLKPKEASLDSPPKEEPPNTEIPNDGNELFDVNGASTISDPCLPSEDEEKDVKPNIVWEHAIDILFKLSPLHADEAYQNMDDMELFYRWGEKCLAIGELSTSYLENSWDKGNPEFLMTNSIKNRHMLWQYLHHLVREAQESSMPGNPFSNFASRPIL